MKPTILSIAFLLILAACNTNQTTENNDQTASSDSLLYPGEKIIFSSNHASERGYQFNLFMINLDGTGLEQITFDPVFDAFPMFSFDGKKLIFSSNRNNKGTRDTKLFLADWVE
jgi:Tol biopolymer transport system component